ncbi:MAG: branched-chain amino acid ABC transporter permease [Spirochaetaceae bacterium]|jgi:branched-chain amino acid transport system permease protein|nr:branched-chain amino acid ABC transporter permease [Spirochaetaceae bacterium]
MDRFRGTIILIFVSAAVVCIPTLLIRAGIIDAYLAQIITIGGVNAIMAVSVNVITGITGQLSIGQAGFMAIGAYAAIFLNLDAGLPLPAAAVISALITAFAGFLIGFPTLKLSGDYLAIVTLGFGEIIRVILVNLKQISGGANGRQLTTLFAIYPEFSFLVVSASLAVILILLQNFLRSTYGRAILAVREDEIAANSSGISVFRYKMLGFVTASFIAGIGGSLYAMVVGFVKPDIASFNKSIDFLIFVVLGGMGSMTGSVISAYVLTSLQEFLRFLEDFRLLIYPLLLISVMLFWPRGLMGMKELSIVGVFNKIAGVIRRRKAPKGGA